MTDHREIAVEAEALLGQWVRMRPDIAPEGGTLYREPGRPFRVWQLGNKGRDGRQRIMGPVECVYPEDVEVLTAAEQEKAREEWERNVR